jgi:hypothetical protein
MMITFCLRDLTPRPPCGCTRLPTDKTATPVLSSRPESADRTGKLGRGSVYLSISIQFLLYCPFFFSDTDSNSA